MIVKNEARILTRLFESVVGVIDCYCICDTGSTDDTVDIIRQYFGSRNVPGKIMSEPFVNFAHNRNAALQGCAGMSDYILLLDADMRLECKPEFNKSMLLQGDCFSVLQGSDDFYYENTRIIKNDSRYRYIGVTHEYIEYIHTPEHHVLKKIPKSTLFIRDIGDGGSKGDKFQRDIALLTQGILDEPDNHRYHFYLANSYYDFNNYGEAIRMYLKRIDLGGWFQEVWYSYYRIGCCYECMQMPHDAVMYWLKAYNFLPKRLESLYSIIKYYRVVGEHKTAKLFYDVCTDTIQRTNVMAEKDTYLFLNNDVYTYKLDYEFSMIAYYNGITNIDDASIAILNSTSNSTILLDTLTNLKFYEHVLQPKATLDMSSSFQQKVKDHIYNFNSSASCILANKNNSGYLYNIRFVNYFIDSVGNFVCGDQIVSINKLVELDEGLNVVLRSERTFSVLNDDRRYLGVEDVRIFHGESDIQFIGTGYHKDGSIGVSVGKYDVDNLMLVENYIKPSFSRASCEKNWVYVDYKGSTHVIYSWCPLRLCKIDLGTKSLDLVETRRMPSFFKNARGSSCSFKYGDEYWFIVHIVSYEQPRRYYHVIAVLDMDMALRRYSAPLKFEGACIEYCLSLIVETDRVIVPYSTWDKATKIAVYDKTYIDRLLKYR